MKVPTMLVPLLLSSNALAAPVDLALWPDATVDVGETVHVALTATSTGQDFYVLDAVLEWDPEVLRLVGNEPAIQYDPDACDSWLMSCICWAVDVNATWEDGDAVYTAFAPPWEPATADADGLVVTVLVFEAVAHGSTTIEIIPAAGEWAETDVLTLIDGQPANATGEYGDGATITVVPAGSIGPWMQALGLGKIADEIGIP